MGFEPTTASLEGWNSTTELRPPLSSSALSSQIGCVLSLSTQYSSLARIHSLWWAGKDSNLGSRWQQIYSLPPLATWVPARKTLNDTIILNASSSLLFHPYDGKIKASRFTHGPHSLLNKDE